ncbi:ketopantoate reductase family protein [Sphingopyxis chilensis]|uniref:ketopantoate reductase family protein n=1 Tax=Sphingopyxis chilensis TaxID=180400 RepID=UPI002DDCC778|nr:ketopantoate reductase family protein [Sphingopyxis chilensis]
MNEKDPDLRICIFGAGAVGGHFAARLAAAGQDVSVVARGSQLPAIRENGLTLISGEQVIQASVAASDNPADLGPQDLVISTVKATALPVLADGIAPLLADHTPVIFAQNGIPWWYGMGLSGSECGAPDLGWLDPDATLAGAIGPARTIGGVIFSSNQLVEPGVVHNDSPARNALVVGEIDDRASERITEIRAALTASGIDSPSAPDIRAVLWSKLINNMTASVLCLLTGRKVSDLAADDQLAETLLVLMAEARAVAASLGYDFGPVDREGLRRAAPDHKPSILQDYEAGRAMEIDALVRAPLAFARHAGVATPALDAVAAQAIALADRARAR